MTLCRLLGHYAAWVQFAHWSLCFLNFFSEVFMVRVSVSFSVSKPGLEWIVDCQEGIPIA